MNRRCGRGCQHFQSFPSSNLWWCSGNGFCICQSYYCIDPVILVQNCRRPHVPQLRTGIAICLVCGCGNPCLYASLCIGNRCWGPPLFSLKQIYTGKNRPFFGNVLLCADKKVYFRWTLLSMYLGPFQAGTAFDVFRPIFRWTLLSMHLGPFQAGTDFDAFRPISGGHCFRCI